MKITWLLPLFALLPSLTEAGPAPLVPPAGIRENTPRVQAFTHARIVVAPGKTLENATLVARDGVIAVGSLAPGKDATLFVSDGDVLDESSHVVSAWIEGKAVDLTDKQKVLEAKYREKYKRLESRTATTNP